MARGTLASRTPGSWTLRVDLEPDPATGKRRQKVETVRGTKRQAEQRLAALLTEAATDQVGNAARMTVAGLAERWLLEHRPPTLAVKTHANYSALVQNQITPTLGRVLLEKMRTSHVLAFKAELRAMQKKGKGRTPGSLSTVRQHQAFTLLNRMLKDAKRWRLIGTNPADGISAPSKVVPEMRPYTADQAAAFMTSSHVQGLAWQAFFELALSTGMRLAELTGLRWSDVHLDRGTVTVAQTMAYVEGVTTDEKGEPHNGWVTKPPKTKAGRRTLPIDPAMIALLRRHKAVQNGVRLVTGKAWTDHDLVFPSRIGTPVHSYIVRKVLARIAAVAEVPVIRVHDLRHTAATLLILAGVPIKVVSERLGHATVLITLQTYAHVLPGQQEDASLKLAALLRGTR